MMHFNFPQDFPHFSQDGQNFRLVYPFQERSVPCFMNQFTEHQARIHVLLGDMEGTAIQLDRMKRWTQISTITGSSVRLVGGELAVVGLALALVTAGVPLSLTLGGLGQGITIGVNSAVSAVTERAVNKPQEKKAREVL